MISQNHAAGPFMSLVFKSCVSDRYASASTDATNAKTVNILAGFASRKELNELAQNRMLACV